MSSYRGRGAGVDEYKPLAGENEGEGTRESERLLICRRLMIMELLGIDIGS